MRKPAVRSCFNIGAMSVWTALTVLLAFCLLGLLVQLGFMRRQLARVRQENTNLLASNFQLTEFVEFDVLTDAMSRRYLTDRLDRRKHDRTHALLFVDLDDFKTVNDGYGHEVGDELLIEIAKSMIAVCRANDFVARIGGDEFCVFLENVNLKKATVIAERFRIAIEGANVTVKDKKVARSASIGVTELAPHQAMMDAIYIADAAQYAAKEGGRNKVEPAGPAVLKNLAKLQTKPTTEEIGKALENGEVTYFVQPIFDLITTKAVGVEALIRWVRPNGRVMGPETFFDLMTQNYRRDFRPPIAAANKLATTFTTMDPPLFCAWNISSSFLSRSLESDPKWIEGLLNGIDPKRTVFEIVESAVIEHPERTRKLLTQMRAAGVRVALDDFGTGLSNLERLVEYPIDIVKIDRSFVSGLGRGTDSAILKGLVTMQDSMGFDIIAEGVERPEELDVLQHHGITKAQGFLLGRPQTVEYWERQILRPDVKYGTRKVK